MALGGMLTAVSVVIMCLGSVIPINTYVCPVLCILVTRPVLDRCGRRIGWCYYLAIYDETVDDSKDIEIFDPENTWKRRTVYNYTAKELQVPVFKDGVLVYDLPSLEEIRDYCAQQVDTLWDEIKRFENPQTYYVDLSQKLWDIKYGLLKDNNCR